MSVGATQHAMQPDVASWWCVEPWLDASVVVLFCVGAAVHDTQRVCFYLLHLRLLSRFARWLLVSEDLSGSLLGIGDTFVVFLSPWLFGLVS